MTQKEYQSKRFKIILFEIFGLALMSLFFLGNLIKIGKSQGGKLDEAAQMWQIARVSFAGIGLVIVIVGTYLASSLKKKFKG
jgi:hypothetical protein